MKKLLTICAVVTMVLAVSGATAGITIEVYPSSAPNHGTPGWSGYIVNALNSLENGLGNIGNRKTDPTAYEIAPAEVLPGEIAVTSATSWRGVYNPPVPFNNEHGNRMHFGLHAYGDGTTQFCLEDLTFEMHSSDPWDSLIFVGDFIGYAYNGSTRYGINWGTDRVKGGGDDTVYTSDHGTTLVDEIVYVGVGNAWWPDFGNAGSQAAMDDYFLFVAEYQPITVTCEYNILTYTGMAAVDVVTAGVQCSTFVAQQVAETSAVLTGNVVEDGWLPCEYRFVYWADGGSPMATDWAGPVQKYDILHYRALDLIPGTLYHYRIEVRNSMGMDQGNVRQFTTLPEPEPEGLVAYYALDGDANDSSGNALHGTLETIGDGNDATFVAGKYGMAIDLLPYQNGTKGSYVNCGADPNYFDLTDAITVGAWVNMRSIPDEWRAIVAKGDSAWRIGNVGADPRFHFGFCGYGSRPTTHGIDGNIRVEFGEWHYVCGTYDITDGARLYVDCVLDVNIADTAGINVNTFDVTIGANMEDTSWKPFRGRPANYRLFDGQIDEVKVYNRALSEAEILYLAQ